MRNKDGTFAKGHKLFVKPDIFKSCPNCLETFKGSKNNPSTKYCCHKCSVEHILKGKPKSREHAEKIKKNNARYWLGKKQTEAHVLKATAALRPYQSGEKHWNWKGGITPNLKAWRFKEWYHTWRTGVFERDGYTCRGCGIEGGDLQAHHIIRFAELVRKKDTEALKDINNGVTYCVGCHKLNDEYAKRFSQRSV